MDDFQRKARALFNDFCTQIAQTDLRHAVALPAAVGAAVALVGVGQEAHGQLSLVEQGGVAALNAYAAMVQAEPVDGVYEYVSRAFGGDLPSFGGQLQGIGVATAYVGSLVSSTSVLLARGFEKLKTRLAGIAEQSVPEGLPGSHTERFAQQASALPMGNAITFQTAQQAVSHEILPAAPGFPKFNTDQSREMLRGMLGADRPNIRRALSPEIAADRPGAKISL